MAIEKVLLAKPRGFCAGVVRAIDTVERVLELLPHPVYVFHEIVHNRAVVEDLQKRGAIFVNRMEEIPEGAACIFSAHGVSPQVREIARRRRLRAFDATCPLVTKVHLEAIRYANAGYSLILIGHPDHEEVVGTMGEAPMQLIGSPEDVESLKVPDPEKVVYLTQTTLSLDDTRQIVEALYWRFPKMMSPAKEDICYATQNRQNAVKRMVKQAADVILVIGSTNSSNSQRLREVSEASGVPAYLINDESMIHPNWFQDARVVGVTAGASAPEKIVLRVIEYLKSLGADVVEELDAEEENVHFALPHDLAELTNVY
jgi:4-hydroxy-3-methylbut-2-enyl diphosphate reductase